MSLFVKHVRFFFTHLCLCFCCDCAGNSEGSVLRSRISCCQGGEFINQFNFKCMRCLCLTCAHSAVRFSVKVSEVYALLYRSVSGFGGRRWGDVSSAASQTISAHPHGWRFDISSCTSRASLSKARRTGGRHAFLSNGIAPSLQTRAANASI